jgi:phospholipid transport system substrate-binding protein
MNCRLIQTRRTLPAALLLILIIAGTAAGHSSDVSAAAVEQPGTAVERSPYEVIRGTSGELVSLIDEARGYVDADPERYHNEVQALLDPVVDFKSFSRLVMATHYKKATVDQRKRFASSFKRSLVKTYASALMQFSNEEIKVLDPTRAPRDPRRPTVNMEITTASGAVYPLSYTMGKNKAGKWQMKNIIINGINLGLTFRNQFGSAVRDQKYGGDLAVGIDSWGGLVSEVVTTGPEGS